MIERRAIAGVLSKRKKRTKVKLFSSDDSSDTVIDTDCQNKSSMSSSTNKKDRSTSSNSVASKTVSNTSNSSSVKIKYCTKADMDKVKSLDEDPEGNDRFKKGVLRENDVLERIASLKLSEQTLDI